MAFELDVTMEQGSCGVAGCSGNADYFGSPEISGDGNGFVMWPYVCDVCGHRGYEVGKIIFDSMK